MATIFMTGFEMGSKSIMNIASNGSISTLITRGSWSSYALEGASQATPGNQVSLDAGTSELYMGFGFYTSNATLSNVLVALLSQNGTTDLDLRLDGAGHLRVTRNGTALDTGGTVLSQNHWYYIEFYALISTTVGKYEVKLDGSSEIALATGKNTQNDTAGGGATVDRFRIAENTAYYVDDVYVNDTTGAVNTGFWGDTRVGAYIPNAAGDHTGLTRGGSDSGTNYGQVDERPANDATDFVYAADTSSYDLYAIPNTSGTPTVNAVTVWARATKSDASAANIALGVKYDSDANGSADTESWGSDLALSTSWDYYRRILDTDPASNAWSAAKVDALQIGVKSR